MSEIIAVRVVKKPRIQRVCSVCEEIIYGVAIDVYGGKETFGKPRHHYVHYGCVTSLDLRAALNKIESEE